jgi:hypothetical protein
VVFVCGGGAAASGRPDARPPKAPEKNQERVDVIGMKSYFDGRLTPIDARRIPEDA